MQPFWFIPAAAPLRRSSVRLEHFSDKEGVGGSNPLGATL